MATIRFPAFSHFDGTFLDEVKMEGDHFVRKRSQPDRNKVMESIQDVQKAGFLNGHAESTLGRWALSIPKADYWNLVAANPDLISSDKQIMDRAWRKFSASPESLPYRMTR